MISSPSLLTIVTFPSKLVLAPIYFLLQLTFDTGSSEVYVMPKTGYPVGSQTAVNTGKG